MCPGLEHTPEEHIALLDRRKRELKQKWYVVLGVHGFVRNELQIAENVELVHRVSGFIFQEGEA